jgi:hypothetical protein
MLSPEVAGYPHVTDFFVVWDCSLAMAKKG